MDAHDLFRKLGAGAKFDFKRFRKDAEKLKIGRFAPGTSITQTAELPVHEVGDYSVRENSTERHLGQRQREKVKRKRNHSEDDVNYEVVGSNDLDKSDSENREKVEATIHLMGGMKAKSTEVTKLNKRQRKKLKKSKKSPALVAALEQEKVNSFRNMHRIHTYGEDVPDPLTSFQQLQDHYSIHSKIVSNIEDLGYSTPTPIQSQAIPVMLNGREILACAPTGSGKTVAFLLPLLHHLKEPQRKGIRALILSPTRELASQTYRECCRLAEGRGFRIHHAGKATSDKVISSKKYDILITTPNRLVYMLQRDPPLINLQSVEWLVIDESDKLFEEGKQGFRDQMAVIYNACDSKNVRRALFSATCSYDVEQWCRLNLDNLVSVYIGARNSASETVEQELLFVGSEAGKLLAVRDIFRKGFHPPVLIFVQSKERAKELFRELIYDGINVDVIHADRTQTERDNVVKGFRSGAIWVLICTELMGRGIDFIGVNLVINYDFPTSAVTYIHRIGRTGRAGHKGKAITFFTEQDSVLLRSIANVMREAGCPVPEYMLALKKPSKKAKKKLAKRAPVRESISTAPKSEYQKARDKYRVKKTSHKTQKSES